MENIMIEIERVTKGYVVTSWGYAGKQRIVFTDFVELLNFIVKTFNEEVDVEWKE
jgi:hypothetical protein